MDNLSQRTAEILSNKIRVEQVYMPGDKLPNENVLSEELGVSRTTLREAIRTLVSEGLLVVRRGLGTFVNETLDQYAEGSVNMDDVLAMKVTLKDLYEARMIIEPAAAALAASRASDEEIDEILRLGDVVQAEIKRHPKGDKRIQSETDFHGAIMRASHNDFLIQFIPVLTETIEKTFALDENLEYQGLRFARR
jgi:DNA-binding FadR family transcriptional regulator